MWEKIKRGVKKIGKWILDHVVPRSESVRMPDRETEHQVGVDVQIPPPVRQEEKSEVDRAIEAQREVEREMNEHSDERIRRMREDQ